MLERFGDNHFIVKLFEMDMADFGIFVRSVEDDLTIIEKCKDLLDSIHSDTKILHVLRDESHGGLKVVFNSDSGVAQLLQKGSLDSVSTFHALTTALIVYESFPKNEEEFKDSIRKKMAAKVLDIRKVPLSAKFPDIGTGKWIIVLDVPEIEDLDEFAGMGPPNDMSLKLPNNSKLKIEFYCRFCQKGGHVQSGCSGLDSSTILSTNTSPKISPKTSSPPKKVVNFPGTSTPAVIPTDRLKQEMPPKNATPSKVVPPTGFRIRDIDEERKLFVLSRTKRDIKDFKVELGAEVVENSLKTLMDVKKEKRDPEENHPSLKDFKNEKSEKEVIPTVARPNSNTPVDFSESIYKLTDFSSSPASSTSKDKDGLEIIYESPPCRPSSSFFQQPAEIDNQVSTTKRRFSDDADDSSNPPAPPRKTLRVLPVVIPDGIRQIISGLPDLVLDIKQMEAFFSHAKKKSRPLEIAKAYTDDVDGFKRQLVEISRKYYMSPNVGTNADIQFVKMLQNVLKRFENAPPTPKRVSLTQQLGFEQAF